MGREGGRTKLNSDEGRSGRKKRGGEREKRVNGRHT